MPTAAKIVAGFLVALLGWWVAHLIIPHLPPETRIGRFREISAVLGFLVGWKFVGKRAVEGATLAITFGIGGAAFLVFWMLFTFSLFEMIKRAFRKSYGGPLEAIQGMVEIAIDYLVYLAPPEVWSTLLAGGAAIGIVAYLVSRRWS